jgi:hypothetical protein
MKTKEQAFTEVMQKQMEYDFLHHKEEKRTSKEIKRDLTQRLERINKTLKEKLSATVLAFMMIFAIGLTSCDKEPIEQRELITQELTLKNIYTMPMTKGFDIDTWVFEYNTTPAIITFTSVDNPAETVTQSVTIQQLMQGINVTIYAGTYNITYQTVHSQTNFTKLDIKINMQNVKVTGTPIALTATYDDYLLIVDMPNVFSISCDYWTNYQMTFTYHSDLNIWYAYSNINDATYSYLIRFADMSTKTFNLGGKVLGQIYWYTSPIGAGTTITFPQWIINKITI